MEREVFPSPHLALGPQRNWLLNCEWGNLRELDYWVRTGIPQAARRGPVVASVSARDIADCSRTCQRLSETPAVLLEVNFSCSHAGQIYGRILDDPGYVAAVIQEIKRVTEAPVIAKLGWSPVLADVARAAENAGADAIAVTNSIGPGLDINVDDGRPRLGIAGGFGGMSGKAIFPIALECASRVATAVSIPTVGIGGITSAVDVIKMIMVGAQCVQLYTAPMLRGFRIFDLITADLRAYLARHGYRSLDEIRGSAMEHLRKPSHLRKRLPIVDVGRCQPCGACERICPVGAITVTQVASVAEATCIGCGICVNVCPPRFDALSLQDDGQ